MSVGTTEVVYTANRKASYPAARPFASTATITITAMETDPLLKSSMGRTFGSTPPSSDGLPSPSSSSMDPVIRSFSFPWRNLVKAQPVFIVLLLTFFTVSPDPLSSRARDYVGWPMIKAIWCGAAVLHSVESMYIVYLCRKHRTGLKFGMMWWLSTLVFGYPICFHFRSLVQAARNDGPKPTTAPP